MGVVMAAVPASALVTFGIEGRVSGAVGACALNSG